MRYQFSTYQGASGAPAFDAYRAIKKDVFVDEQGWELPLDDGGTRARQEAADAEAILATLELADTGKIVGGVRGSPAAGEFPHRELFEQHLNASEVQAIRPHLWTANALAVRPEHRGERCQFPGITQPITPGMRVFCLLIDAMREAGAAALVVSATPQVTAIPLSRLGFYIIDPLTEFDSPFDAVLNMALMLNDDARFREIGSPLACTVPADTALSPDQESCRDYFAEREAEILAGVDAIDKLRSYKAALATAAKT